MKKISLLAMLALTGAAAQAQTSVQLYGLIDAAVEHVSNVAAGGASRVRMTDLSGGIAPSRLGFRGTEDLGAGLKSVFTAEMGIAPDSGAMNQGGRAFGRQIFVGLSGGWGAVTLGRQYTMIGSSLADIDVMGPSQYALGSLDPYLPNARSDNAIAYRGTFSGVTVGATYSLGRDVGTAGGPGATSCAGEDAVDKRACRQWSALVRYDAARWGIAAAYDTYNGGTGALAAFGPTSSSLSDTRINVGAYGKFGPIKVGGGMLRRTNEGVTVATPTANPRSVIYYLGLAYDVTSALVIDGQISRYDLKDSGNDTRMAIVRATYNFSKRTAVYALVGNVRNGGTAARSVSAGNTVAPGGTQTGIMTGIKHSF
jgi:predicted porin